MAIDTQNEKITYVYLEATYPHRLLLCMKKILNGKKQPLRDEVVFLDQFRENYPECENEWKLLRLAYEQNVIDDFFEVDPLEEWRKKSTVQKALLRLVKIISEKHAVLLLESLMFAFGWKFSVKMKRRWSAPEKEQAFFHDLMRIQPEDLAKMFENVSIREDREIPARKRYTGQVMEEDRETVEEKEGAFFDAGDVPEFNVMDLPEMDGEDITSANAFIDSAPEQKEMAAEVKSGTTPQTAKEQEKTLKQPGNLERMEQPDRRQSGSAGKAQKLEQAKYYQAMNTVIRKRLLKAMSGEVSSQCGMGDYYADKSSDHLDYEEAVRWYEMAAEKGYERAYFEIGKIYDMEAAHEERSKEKALKIYTKLAEQGYPTAQCVLGMKYLLGDGVKEDANMAKKWLERAAMQRHTAAIRNLADLYQSIRDKKNAEKWYRIGAANGDDYCRRRLRGSR